LLPPAFSCGGQNWVLTRPATRLVSDLGAKFGYHPAQLWSKIHNSKGHTVESSRPTSSSSPSSAPERSRQSTASSPSPGTPPTQSLLESNGGIKGPPVTRECKLHQSLFDVNNVLSGKFPSAPKLQHLAVWASPSTASTHPSHQRNHPRPALCTPFRVPISHFAKASTASRAIWRVCLSCRARCVTPRGGGVPRRAARRIVPMDHGAGQVSARSCCAHLGDAGSEGDFVLGVKKPRPMTPNGCGAW